MAFAHPNWFRTRSFCSPARFRPPSARAQAPVDPAAAVAPAPPPWLTSSRPRPRPIRWPRRTAPTGTVGRAAAPASARSARPAAPADPFAPGAADDLPEGTPAGQNPTPYTGEPVFLPPSFNPVNGSMVGVAKPIIINFQRPIVDRPMAEQAIHISSNPPVPGKFYWMSDTQVRWRPIDFWPANTTVNIDASGAKSTFRTGESLVATIDDKRTR